MLYYMFLVWWQNSALPKNFGIGLGRVVFWDVLNCELGSSDSNPNWPIGQKKERKKQNKFLSLKS